MKKRIIVKVILAIILLITPFVVLFSFDLAIKEEYSNLYYAELGKMYNKLTKTEGKKIVIIGNSNVAFGVESKLFEELFNENDNSYTVVNFGLYGSIGTKAMLDLALEHINKDDIVIFVPEEINQSMSLYFSATEMWYALDSNRTMFNDLDSRSKEALVGNYCDYVSKKYKSSITNKSNNLGIYQLSSFDDNCDLTNYTREYNVMYNDKDENNPIDLTKVEISDNFFDYVNEYNDSILKKGAKMYYSFAPMNKENVLNNQKEIEGFYETVRGKINFPVISDINRYIMDKEWFYDSDFHLNTSGMKIRTSLLVDDLKNELGITSKNNFVMIDKPVKPQTGIEGEGDNSCSDCFTYEMVGNYYKITGLTEIGKTKEELIIPYQVDGIYISEFSKDVFLYNKNVKKIVIQKNIKRIYDESFYGCEKLVGVYLLHDSPSEISVGFNLLVGTAANVYVDNSILSSFINEYFWGRYQERLKGYEKN